MGISQEYLAGEARISVESVGALERGVRRAPYRDTVRLLSTALRLDDAKRVEFEVAADDARARGGRTPKISPNQRDGFPIPLTSFVGRTLDLTAISGLLDTNRLVTVTGTGGIGKTRTVIEVASRLTAMRWERMTFVDLSPLTDGRFIVGTIALAMGLHADAGHTTDDLVAALRSKRALLILDNCEHLIGEVAILVSAVLQRCEQISILATSRERLAIGGEAVYRLPSLEIPKRAPQTLELARGFAAVELFIQRADGVEGDIGSNPAIVASVLEICRRLEGIPLAIELAAARVGALGIVALRDRLHQGLALSGGARNMPTRQQTMLATISWSYDLLDESERLVLQHLAIFAGGFTLAAADAVCTARGIDARTITPCVSSLVDKSLVNIVSREDTVRYSLLESVRAFALERVADAGQRNELSATHAQWVASFADWVDSERANRPEQWLRTDVDPELENARTALAWSLGAGSDAILAGRIVGGLRTIWLTSGRRSECKSFALEVLDAIDEERYPTIAAPIFRALVQIATGDEMLVWAQRAITTFERIEDRLGIALLEAHVSAEYRRRGLLAQAEAAISRAGAFFERSNDQRRMPHSAFLHNRLMVRLDQARYPEALADAEEGRAIVRSLGDDDAFLWTLLRADIEFAMGRREAALRATEDLIAPLTEYGPSRVRLLSLANAMLGFFHLSMGNIERGYAFAREALEYSRFRTFDEDQGNTIELLALAAAMRGKPAVAARLSGAIDTLFHRARPYDECPGGGCDKRCRMLLLETLNRALTQQELALLREEGARFTPEVALAEAESI
jgi:predicted ATPase